MLQTQMAGRQPGRGLAELPKYGHGAVSLFRQHKEHLRLICKSSEQALIYLEMF